MTISATIAMLLAFKLPAARWREEQTAAEHRIRRSVKLIEEKTTELNEALAQARLHRLRLDLVTRAGARLRTSETLAASFGQSIADMGQRIAGHD